MKPEFKAGSNNYLAFLFFEPSDILPMPKPLGGGIVNRNSKFPLLPSVQEIGNFFKIYLKILNKKNYCLKLPSSHQYLGTIFGKLWIN